MEISMYSKASFIFLLITSMLYGAKKDPVMIIRQNGQEFDIVSQAIISEIQNQFTVHQLIVTKKSSVANVSAEIRSVDPKLVVLMDNLPIALYKNYQSGINDSSKYIPSIALMGVLIEETVKNLKNATGISYEIPVITGVMSLQSIVHEEIGKVGIVHREFLNTFIQKNKMFCEKEGVDLVTVSLPDKSNSFKIQSKKALEELITVQGVKVIWMPIDNVLLNQEILNEVWLPIISKHSIAVIVGAEILTHMKFGTIAVLPDHVSLGKQAADLIFEVKENHWKVPSSQVQPPLAVHKVVNYRQMKKLFDVSESALRGIDKIVK